MQRCIDLAIEFRTVSDVYETLISGQVVSRTHEHMSSTGMLHNINLELELCQ
jgi:hypothetical protein